ncbi:MAG: class IV adenylate cyclase [Candidatus Marsarchaeota archaeon]|jgi:adenylate cyclase class 2|nr:class IV adenylate cyclase [Candidatus Marsarchaeota archaeon]
MWPDSIEQEMKIPVESFDNVLEFLKQSGSFKGESRQHDVYFTDTTRYSSHEGSFVMRIRRTESKAFMTFKGSTGRSGVYDECEIEVKDPDTAETMMKKLGFKPFLEITKHRVQYEFNGAEVNLDDVQGLGKFIEIEIISEGNADSELSEVAGRLGLDANTSIRVGYVTQLLQKTGSEYSKFMQY